MPIRFLDRAELKGEARGFLRSAKVSPFLLTLLLLAIDLFLDEISDVVNFVLDLPTLSPASGLSLSFISILTGLISLVLSAGYSCYALGVYRRENMPYESLFDAFSFAGKVIWLSVMEVFFVFLWSMLFIIPGIIAAFRYSFAIWNLCRDPSLSASQALNLSKQQTFGYKWQLFLLELSFIGWLFLGVVMTEIYARSILPLLPVNLIGVVLNTFFLACFTGVVNIYLMPYMNFSVCGFYLRAVGSAQTAPDPSPSNPWDPER